MTFCTRCGAAQPENGHFCFKCGAALVRDARTEPATEVGGQPPAATPEAPPPQPQQEQQQQQQQQAAPHGKTSVRIVGHQDRRGHQVRPPFAVQEDQAASAGKGDVGKQVALSVEDMAPAGAVVPPVEVNGDHQPKWITTPGERRKGRAFVSSLRTLEAHRNNIFPDTMPNPTTPPRLRCKREEKERIRKGLRAHPDSPPAISLEAEMAAGKIRLLRVKKKHAASKNGMVLDENLLVTDVTPCGPADVAGVTVGMRIVAVDGEYVHDVADTVSLFKANRSFQLSVQLPEQPESPSLTPPRSSSDDEDERPPPRRSSAKKDRRSVSPVSNRREARRDKERERDRDRGRDSRGKDRRDSRHDYNRRDRSRTRQPDSPERVADHDDERGRAKEVPVAAYQPPPPLDTSIWRSPAPEGNRPYCDMYAVARSYTADAQASEPEPAQHPSSMAIAKRHREKQALLNGFHNADEAQVRQRSMTPDRSGSAIARGGGAAITISPPRRQQKEKREGVRRTPQRKTHGTDTATATSQKQRATSASARGRRATVPASPQPKRATSGTTRRQRPREPNPDFFRKMADGEGTPRRDKVVERGNGIELHHSPPRHTDYGHERRTPPSAPARSPGWGAAAPPIGTSPKPATGPWHSYQALNNTIIPAATTPKPRDQQDMWSTASSSVHTSDPTDGLEHHRLRMNRFAEHWDPAPARDVLATVHTKTDPSQYTTDAVPVPRVITRCDSLTRGLDDTMADEFEDENYAPSYYSTSRSSPKRGKECSCRIASRLYTCAQCGGDCCMDCCWRGSCLHCSSSVRMGSPTVQHSVCSSPQEDPYSLRLTERKMGYQDSLHGDRALNCSPSYHERGSRHSYGAVRRGETDQEYTQRLLSRYQLG